MADAKAEDIQELLGGALFKALYKWMVESGPVYLLPTGNISSSVPSCDQDFAMDVGSEGRCIQLSCFLVLTNKAAACRSCLKLPGCVRPGSRKACPQIH